MKEYSQKKLKTFVLFFSIFLITFISFSYAAVDQTKPWHPLKQIATDDTGGTSVDEDKDGIIDNAETLKVVGGKATIGDGTQSVALVIKGLPSAYSAVDFYSNNVNMWGIGREPDGNFYIDRAGVGNVLTIDKNTRNIGIGTTSPTSPLHVEKSLATTYAGQFINTNSNQGGGLYIKAGGTSAGTYGDIVRMLDGDGTVRMLIQGNGNVGIGTTSPRNLLTIEKDFTNADYDNAQVSIRGASDTAKRLNLGYETNLNVGFIQAAQAAVAYRNLLLNPQGGNVGIGMTSPSQKLDVNGNIKATDVCTTAGKCLSTAGSGGISGSGSTNYLAKWTGPDSLGDSIIYDDGRVGIGVTDIDPGIKLDVDGKINMRNPTVDSDTSNIVATKGYVDENTRGSNLERFTVVMGIRDVSYCPSDFNVIETDIIGSQNDYAYININEGGVFFTAESSVNYAYEYNYIRIPNNWGNDYICWKTYTSANGGKPFISLFTPDSSYCPSEYNNLPSSVTHGDNQHTYIQENAAGVYIGGLDSWSRNSYEASGRSFMARSYAYAQAQRTCWKIFNGE